MTLQTAGFIYSVATDKRACQFFIFLHEDDLHKIWREFGLRKHGENVLIRKIKLDFQILLKYVQSNDAWDGIYTLKTGQ